MNILKRSLAMFLVLCMLISVVPMTTFAAEIGSTDPVVTEPTEVTENPTEAAGALDPVVFSASSSDFLKVFHLDCGRKYFTVDQVKELIDAISAVGFSHMELAIGNDGLRLLLDDMSITANGTTYASETVKSGIKSGNASYSHSGEWTEAEMDGIIDYAKTKGIEIIPLVNNPGHMDSILVAMKACDIDGYYAESDRTVDLENEKAVAFTQALVMKYADYFASKGCSYFNIGADEYANDYHTADSTGMGFGYLIDNNMYGNFITYVNTLVDDICNLGMTPIAFNDGIYFRENTSFGTFDTRLMIASWTGGWGGIKPASTTFLASKGHQILNTNERWYYVLGRAQAFNSTYCYESALSNAKSESVTTVTDHTGAEAVGAMQCVWCDDPSVDYETCKSNVMTLISTLAENNPTYFTGPNSVEPETVTKTDENTGVSASAPGLSGLEIEQIRDEANIPSIEGVSQILAYDVKAFAGEEAYTGEIEISVPVPDDWTRVRGGVLASDSGREILDIEGRLEKGVFTFKAPHLSGVVVYASDFNQLVELEVGGSYEFKVKGKDLSGTFTPNPEGVANVTVSYEKVDGETKRTLGNTVSMSSNGNYTGVIKSGDFYLIMDASGEISSTTDINDATVFTVVRSGNYSNRIYTISNDTHYLSVSNNSLTSATAPYNWSYSNGFQYSTGAWYPTTYYLNCSNGNWTVSTNGTRSQLYNYNETTTEPVDESTVTFTAVAAGETYVTVDGVVYKIVVSRKAESATITVGETKTYADNSTSEPVVTDPSVVDAAIEEGTLTITAKAVGATTVTTDNAVYTITVVEFNPALVNPLTVEYWITNIITRTVESTSNNPVTTQQISAGAAGVATAEGADINAMMPAWTIKKDGDSGEDRKVEFWHVRLLDKVQSNNSSSGTEEQTAESADDETTNGDAVTRVRYYDPGDGNGRRWQLLAGSTWMDVTSDNQIVAYYMEVVDIQNANGTTELHVNAADWGKLGDGSPASSYADTSKYCSISLQIVYEDGSANPAGTTAEDLDSKTLIFNYWDGGRGIGTFAFDTLGQFNIYQITAETGSVNAAFNGGAWGTAQVSSFAWDHNEKVVWSGESETASIYNNTSNPTNEDPKDNLMWDENKEAILIRVYVRAVETEDSLAVVYIDEKFNDTLYSYNIQVEAGHDFKNNMIGTPARMENNRINVTGCGIENIYGQTQNFQTDLTLVPEAKGKYDSELYTYTGSEISEDGKTLYLYYNIDTAVLKPNFVVDFGLPITFELNELLGKGTEVDDVAAVSGLSARYGNLTYDSTTKKFTYTPTKILQRVDVLSINILFDGQVSATTTNVGVTPATTVYYEESFITWDSQWTGGNAAVTVGNQTTEVLGEKQNNFGYDPVYANTTSASNGTNATTSTIGATGTFTFTGNGIQVFANSTENSGRVSVEVKNSSGAIVNLSMVDTVVDPGKTGATNGQTGSLYGLPVVSLIDLQNIPHDTYTVTITKVMDSKPVYIDGIRVFNTMEDSTIFTADWEDNPSFFELRDAVLHAIGVGEDTSVDYETMYEQVYNDIADAQALITDESVSYGSSETIQDLLDNGPKNEIYLYAGQTLTFKVSTNRVMQLGMKAPQGAATASISVDDGTTTTKNQEIGSSVDMFYTLANNAESETTYTVQIQNTGDKILSITELKICDDPNAAFVPFTAEDIKEIMCGDPADETPTEPETPVEPEEPVIVYADAVLTVNVVDYTGAVLGTVECSANGVEGETRLFTAEEILAAAQAQIPEKYELVDESAVADVEVVYGEAKESNVQIGKVATLNITFVNLFGRKQGTATVSAVQTADGYCRISSSEIKAAAPAGRRVIWLMPVYVPYGNTVSIIVPVI